MAVNGRSWLAAAIVLVGAATAAETGPGLAVFGLQCEWLANPMGVVATKPRLSWIVTAAGSRGRPVDGRGLRRAGGAARLGHGHLCGCGACLATGGGGRHDRERLGKLTAAFAAKYLRPDGTLSVETQTACVLALGLGLLPPERSEPVVNQLVGLIERAGYRMTTGFLGTKSILPVLSAHGHHDLACRPLAAGNTPGVKAVRAADGRVIIEAGSGDYVFTVAGE